jgi:hypothetical protein
MSIVSSTAIIAAAKLVPCSIRPFDVPFFNRESTHLAESMDNSQIVVA